MFIKRFLLIVLFSSLLFAQGFEGYVKYKIESEGDVTHMKYFKKGENVRMEPEMDQMEMGGAMLFKDGKTYVLMPSQKMYMEFKMDSFSSMMPEEETKEEEMGEMKQPVKTGETKEILGYTTEKWIFEDEDYTSEVWVAKGLGDFVMMSTPMGQNEMPEWYNDLSEGGFFPMLVIAKNADGSIDGRMEVVEINEESLSQDMFEIPDGYSKFNMPGGGGY